MKRAAPKASQPSLSDASSQTLFDALSQYVWHGTPLCAEAQTMLKNLQAKGALSDPAAKSLATSTAKTMQHFKGGGKMPPWDPAVAGPMIALFADSPVGIPVGREDYEATHVLVAYWVARGGAEGALEALWHAAKFCDGDGILAASDPASDEAKENAQRFAELVRDALGKKGLREAEPIIDGLIGAGEWYQRWAVAFVAPSAEILAKLKKSSGGKAPNWLDALPPAARS